MKRFIPCVTLLAVFNFSFASDIPEKELVEKYIKAAHYEQIVSVEIDSYTRQFGAHATSTDKERLRQYFSNTMGWDVLKDQYESAIAETFTKEELTASLAFLESPIGSSIAKKEEIFTDKISTLIAKNTVQTTKQESEKVKSESTTPASDTNDLIMSDIQERKLNGSTYFIGTIQNQGKRPAQSVEVEVNLFQSGKFVDQYTTYITGSLAPGVVRYFKVSCGCKNSPPAKHDSFKIQLVGGY